MSGGGSLGEMGEPSSGNELQPSPVERVDAFASSRLHADQPGELELSEVPARGGPRAVEARGDLASGHLAAVEVQRQEDLPAGSMREGGKDLVEVLELALRVAPTQAQRAAARAGTPCLVVRSAAP